MNHDQLKEKIFEFTDAELSAGEAADVQAHLKTCAECQTALMQWQKTATVFFRSAPAPEPSEYFVTRVMARLEDPRPDFHVRLIPSFWRLGAALSLMLFVWGLWPSNGPSPASIETLLFADGRSSVVSDWVADDQEISTDEFAQYALEVE